MNSYFSKKKKKVDTLPAMEFSPNFSFFSRLFLLTASLLTLFLAGCSSTGLVHFSDPEDMRWSDDHTLASLEAAVEQSIIYFRKLPENAAFKYGKHSYSPGELIKSHQLFITLRRTYPNLQDFTQQISEKFHFFESKAEKENLFTGYYEPILRGSPTPTAQLNTPIYPRPDNMVEINLSEFGDDLPSRKLIGRIEGQQILPFYSRREIQGKRPLRGKLKPIAYVNEIDLFFLQIQGSGIVEMSNGKIIRVGYHAHNGHPYRSIGAKLIRDDVMTLEEVSMQSIRDHLRKNPERVRSILYSNPSYVFFRLLDGPPLGNINVPLTPGRSLAADHWLLPKGALAYLASEAPLFGETEGTRPFTRFMLIQDTGGAIRGHGRGDIFFGQGPEAEWRAGHMKHTGRLFVMVAKKEFLDFNLAETEPPEQPAAN